MHCDCCSANGLMGNINSTSHCNEVETSFRIKLVYLEIKVHPLGPLKGPTGAHCNGNCNTCLSNSIDWPGREGWVWVVDSRFSALIGKIPSYPHYQGSYTTPPHTLAAHPLDDLCPFADLRFHLLAFQVLNSTGSIYPLRGSVCAVSFP